MKVAIDLRSAVGERTGKGNYAFHIARNLIQQDPANQYYIYTRDPIVGFQEFKNVEVREVKSFGPLWHHAVVRDLKKNGVQIFIAPSSYIIPTLLPPDIKSVIVVHDLVAFLFPRTHNKKATIIEKLTLKKALKKTSHVITVSENTKQDLIKNFDCVENQISTIYCGASTGFRPLKKETLKDFISQTKLPEKFYLAVGTIEPRKNYPRLIDAFAKVVKINPDYHLIIVGGQGWDYQETYERIRKNYLEGRVHMLGYLSEKSLINLYNLAEALVFPSLYEGFGIPPLEAIQCGCPVIASNVSSIPEVLGQAAIYIDPQNTDSIAKAMLTITKDHQLRENLRNQSLIQSKKFSWQSSAKQLLEIIKSL